MNVRSIVPCMVLAAGGLLTAAETPTNPSDIAAVGLPMAAETRTKLSDIAAESVRVYILRREELGSEIQERTSLGRSRLVYVGRNTVDGKPLLYVGEEPAEDPKPGTPPDVGEF